MTTATASQFTKLDAAQQERLEWAGIEKYAMPDCDSMKEYRLRTVLGSMFARNHLERMRDPFPGQGDLSEAHRLMFVDTLRDAGSLRPRETQLAIGGKMTADSAMVPVELERLEAESAEMLDAADSPQQDVLTIAFWQARYLAVHPFRHGTAMIGRMALCEQCSRMCEIQPLTMIKAIQRDQVAFNQGIDAAIGSDDLGPLARFLGSAMGIEMPQGEIQSPFRIAARPMLFNDDVGDLDQERERARTGAEMPVFGAPSMDIT